MTVVDGIHTLHPTQYILYTIEGALAQLLEFGILAPTPPSLTSKELAVGPIEALRAQVNDLARQLLPELVGLVDAFAFSDWDLNSEVRGREAKRAEVLHHQGYMLM